MTALTLYIFFIAILIFFMVFRQRRLKRKQQDQPSDPRKYINPNSTNYNMAMYDRSDLEDMSNKELKDFLKELRSSETTSALSPRDFHYIQGRLNEEK